MTVDRLETDALQENLKTLDLLLGGGGFGVTQGTSTVFPESSSNDLQPGFERLFRPTGVFGRL